MSAFTVQNFLSLLVVLAGSTVLSTALQIFLQRKKLDVDMSKTKADGAAVLSTAAIAQVDAMGRRLDKAMAALDAWRLWGRNAVAQARAKGIFLDDPPDDWF